MIKRVKGPFYHGLLSRVRSRVGLWPQHLQNLGSGVAALAGWGWGLGGFRGVTRSLGKAPSDYSSRRSIL